MDTSAIAYRVADFLKQHPPFHVIDEASLRALAAGGRVRFFEANEYILWQGEPHKSYVFVIQQGTVSLWDEGPGRSALRDMRGAGDLLGTECFTGAPCCLYSATSSSDVVIYALRTDDFERLVLEHPDARRFIEAYDTVTASGISADGRDPQHLTVQQVVADGQFESCGLRSTVQDAARLLTQTAADAVVVVHDDQRPAGVVTAQTVLEWIASGGDTQSSLQPLLPETVPFVHSRSSIADASLAVADSPAGAVLVGGATGDEAIRAVLTRGDIGRAFGDDPASIVRDITRAPDAAALRALNMRVRAMTLRHLSDAAAVEWLARFVTLADTRILRRIVTLAGGDGDAACWCVCGTAGRGESFTAHVPELLVIAGDEAAVPAVRHRHERVREALTEAGYASRGEIPFDAPFRVATVAEWQRRFDEWLRDPVRTEMYRARPLFDLRSVHGDARLWATLEERVASGVDPTFLLLLANDCMANLPPLTFFHDAVLDTAGEQAAVFRLEETALRPLVDVGRVFGLAARRVMGTSTVERLKQAATLHPEQQTTFVEAAATFRILLRQQARVGISQNGTGSELPPAMVSRHDRHVLKSGFRSILALLEFARSAFWLESA